MAVICGLVEVTTIFSGLVNESFSPGGCGQDIFIADAIQGAGGNYTFEKFQEEQFDRLAEVVRKHIDITFLREVICL